MELFFCYWVQRPVGYMQSGWYILHIETDRSLFESISKQGRKRCEGTFEECLTFVKEQIPTTNEYLYPYGIGNHAN